MTTVYLGIEEMIARQRQNEIAQTARQTRRLTDFGRTHRPAHEHSRSSVAEKMARMTELVELSRLQLHWAML